MFKGYLFKVSSPVKFILQWLLVIILILFIISIIIFIMGVQGKGLLKLLGYNRASDGECIIAAIKFYIIGVLFSILAIKGRGKLHTFAGMMLIFYIILLVLFFIIGFFVMASEQNTTGMTRDDMIRTLKNFRR